MAFVRRKSYTGTFRTSLRHFEVKHNAKIGSPPSRKKWQILPMDSGGMCFTGTIDVGTMYSAAYLALEGSVTISRGLSDAVGDL